MGLPADAFVKSTRWGSEERRKPSTRDQILDAIRDRDQEALNKLMQTSALEANEYLYEAINSSSCEVLGPVLSAGHLDISEWKLGESNPLIHALRNRHEVSAEYLSSGLTEHEDQDSAKIILLDQFHGDTCLSLALENGYANVISILIEWDGIRVTQRDLEAAIGYESPTLISILLGKVLKVDLNNLLKLAVWKGGTAVCGYLVDQGADPFRTSMGRSPMSMAMQFKRLDLVDLFRTHKNYKRSLPVFVDAFNQRSDTAFEYALKLGSNELVDMLR